MITFQSHSGIYTLEVKQFINLPMEEAWHFFSSPTNLSKITPDSMRFKITSVSSGSIYPGQIITYCVSPIFGVKTNWVTEITHVSDGFRFVDEQRFGPFRMWHHEHHFEKQNDGVLMTDRVAYKLPFGFLGRILHQIIIKNQITQIFVFRKECLAKLFQ